MVGGDLTVLRFVRVRTTKVSVQASTSLLLEARITVTLQVRSISVISMGASSDNTPVANAKHVTGFEPRTYRGRVIYIHKTVNNSLQ